MMKCVRMQVFFRFVFLAFTLFVVCVAHAQRPQDNWYFEKTWTKTMAATNGGLSASYGVAIGFDSRIYMGDQGLSRIQVYLPDGTFSFAITNTFGDGQSFSQPRGMITDKDGNLFVADYGRNAVFVFSKDGAFIRKVGGVTGSGDGQLSGVMDVGVTPSEDIYILEQDNARVSVFDSNGVFVRSWGGPGTLEGQLSAPRSLALSNTGEVLICQGEIIKFFNGNGVFLKQMDCYSVRYYNNGDQQIRLWPVSVRVDASGLICVVKAWYNLNKHVSSPSSFNPEWSVFQPDGTLLDTQTLINAPLNPLSGYPYLISWPCHAIDPSGSLLINLYDTRQQTIYRRTFREQCLPLRNAAPMPAVVGIQQRPNSPLVDIDYQVTDADDTNVYACLMVFTNATQSLANCMRSISFAEGTETNLGAVITANQPHRVTWNAGADLNTKLGDFRVAILAKDSRQRLLDIHYIRLPADRGMPALKISRSPLLPNDFMQVWWWLLATQDSGIRLTGGRIYGSGGALDAKLLCDATGTTADGRIYVYAKMNVREASSQEVQWAKEGALAGNVNQWSPTGMTVAGRPMKVNEYGFDTGSWGASAWWVVPLY